MLAQPSPMPIIGRYSQPSTLMPGSASIAAPDAARHAAWTIRAPYRRVTGTSASALTNATAL